VLNEDTTFYGHFPCKPGLASCPLIRSLQSSFRPYPEHPYSTDHNSVPAGNLH